MYKNNIDIYDIGSYTYIFPIIIKFIIYYIHLGNGQIQEALFVDDRQPTCLAADGGGVQGENELQGAFLDEQASLAPTQSNPPMAGVGWLVRRSHFFPPSPRRLPPLPDGFPSSKCFLYFSKLYYYSKLYFLKSTWLSFAEHPLLISI